MTPLRIYIDTSVFGGYFEPEFSTASRALIADVRSGKTIAIVSDIVAGELLRSPEQVRHVMEGLPSHCMELFRVGPEVEELAQAYLDAGVVTEKSRVDATHVAAASVARANAIVSWNFKHIVNLRRIHGFNGVNIIRGYAPLDIQSPAAALLREDRDE